MHFLIRTIAACFCVLQLGSSTSIASAFIPQQKYQWHSSLIPASVGKETNNRKFGRHEPHSILHLPTRLMLISGNDQALAAWVATFSASHIGMSAMRDQLIDTCGQFATSLNIVNRGLTLPSYWPSDNVGKNELLPDEDTAGGKYIALALLAYLSSTQFTTGIDLTESQYNAYLLVAAVASGAAISSLFNASPLSLMPGFEKDVSNEDGDVSSSPILGIQRNDSLKFHPFGLTRITRHPLILPVVPWGLANSMLAGGRLADFILFSGLSAYAITGCAAQDLRVIRKEGSVGTVFNPNTSATTGDSLQQFFASTSFVPFGAVLDGRQSINDIVREISWIAFGAGSIVGVLLEKTILEGLGRMV